MIGLYVTYIFSAWLGIEPYIAVIAILPLVTLLASLSFRFLIRPIIGTSEHNQVVVTLGISLILQNVALVVFSADLRTIPSAFSSSKLYIGDVIIRSTAAVACRAEEHTSELQSLMRSSYAVFCLQKKKT